MTSKETILTAEGLAKLEAELEELRTVKRLENEERLHEAIAHGDLSENSEPTPIIRESTISRSFTNKCANNVTAQSPPA